MSDDDNIVIGPVRDADTGEIETPASETGSGDGQGLGEENFDGDDVSSFDPENDSDEDPEPEPEDTGSDGTPTAIVAGDPGSTEGVQTVGEGQTEAEAQVDAATNPRFDADPGTEIDAAETALGTSQADGTSLREINRRNTGDTQDNTQQETRAGQDIDERFTQFAFEAARQEQVQDTVDDQLQEVQGQPGGRQILPETGPFGSDADLTRDFQTFDPQIQPGATTVAENPAVVTPQASEVEDTDTVPNPFPTFDFGVRDVNRDVEDAAQDVLPNSTLGNNLADTAGIVSAAGTSFGQGFVNAPAGAFELVDRPRETTEEAIQEIGEDLTGGQGTGLDKVRQVSAIGSLGAAAVTGGIGLAPRLGRLAPDADSRRTTPVQTDTDTGTDTRQENIGKLFGDEDEDAITDPSDLESTGRDTERTPAPETGVRGEPFRPETPEFQDILTGDTPQKTPERKEVLDPRELEGVDPVTFTPEGGTTDVTPTQSRTEALKLLIERSRQDTRQQAQFDVQDFGEDSSILSNTRKGQAQLVQKEKPRQPDTDADSRRRIGGDDRRQDVADNQVQFTESLDRPEPRRQDRQTETFDPGFNIQGVPSIGAGILSGARQGTGTGIVPDTGLDQAQDFLPDTGQDNRQRSRPEEETNTPPLFGRPQQEASSFTESSFLPETGMKNQGGRFRARDGSGRTRDLPETEREDEEDLFPFFEDEASDVQDQAGFAPSLSATVFDVEAEAEDFDEDQVFSGLETRPLLR